LREAVDHFGDGTPLELTRGIARAGKRQ
jgi:hypothetical protein